MKNIRKSILWNQFPPQPGIVLAFENPPDVVGAIDCLIDEVPAGFEECDSGLHLGCGFARASIATCKPGGLDIPETRGYTGIPPVFAHEAADSLISTDGNTFCFNRLGYVYITENTDQGWTYPDRIKSIPYHTYSCCLSPDANSIYFFMCLSFTRSIQNSYDPSKGWSLHRCMRTSQGWSLPQELGPPFTSSGQAWGFSVAADKSIYFWGSKIPYGRGCFWVAPFVGNTWPRAIKIPVEKGNLKGCDPVFAPDESFIVFYSKRPGAPGGTETDLYLTLRRPAGTWTKPRNMGPKINTAYYHEFGARISPDKKYMFFTRSNGWGENSNRDTFDIYWVELKEHLPESYR